MNAPWTPGQAGARDPFAAFICDDATLDLVRSITVEMGWQPEKCHQGGLRNAVQSLSVSASPNILLVDLSESGDPLNDINGLAEVCEPGTVVVAMGQVNDVRLYRDLVISGLQDYLLKPISGDQLRDALVNAQATFAAPRQAEGDAVRPHATVAVIGTRGGVGASTIATSLSWLFSQDALKTTALLDLDVHFGTGALTMDLEPGRGLSDAIDNPSRIDGLFIERAMIKANERLSILSAETPISSPLMTDGAAFFQLQEEFRQAFDMSVIDLPRAMLINFPHLMNDVNVAVLVAEMTLASARDTIRILSWLKRNAAHVRPIVVGNKVQPSAMEITKQDFEASIEAKVNYMLPYDAKAAANAAKLGQAFAAANKASKVTAEMRKLALSIVESAEDTDAGDEDTSSKKSKPSLMDRFGGLASVIPSKKKASAG